MGSSISNLKYTTNRLTAGLCPDPLWELIAFPALPYRLPNWVWGRDPAAGDGRLDKGKGKEGNREGNGHGKGKGG